MGITMYERTLALGSMEDECPEQFDPGAYKKTIEAYKALSVSSNRTPTVEYIFERVIKYLEAYTFREIQGKAREHFKFDPDYSEEHAKELAEIYATRAVLEATDGIHEEILSILQYNNLTYRTYSMRTDYDTGIMNPAQISAIHALRHGRNIFEDEDYEDDDYYG